MSSRAQTLLALLAAAAATLATILLDPWAYRHLVLPSTYDHDWGRLLRVYGSLVLWAPLALAVWLDARGRASDRARRGGLMLLGGPLAAGGVAEVIKLLIRRERPGLHDGGYVFRAFGDRPFYTGDIGFPSSHTMVAFAGAAVLARLFPRTAPVAYLLAAGCGLTRILAHAHFASDVVAGAICGWAVVAILWRWAGPSSSVDGAHA
jgi:membrane-associated phospholipid phosphatase